MNQKWSSLDWSIVRDPLYFIKIQVSNDNELFCKFNPNESPEVVTCVMGDRWRFEFSFAEPCWAHLKRNELRCPE